MNGVDDDVLDDLRFDRDVLRQMGDVWKGYEERHQEDLLNRAIDKIEDLRVLANLARRIIDESHGGLKENSIGDDGGVVLDWFGFLSDEEIAAVRRVEADA